MGGKYMGKGNHCHYIFKINLKKFILRLSSFVKVCKEQEKKEEYQDGG